MKPKRNHFVKKLKKKVILDVTAKREKRSFLKVFTEVAKNWSLLEEEVSVV